MPLLQVCISHMLHIATHTCYLWASLLFMVPNCFPLFVVSGYLPAVRYCSACGFFQAQERRNERMSQQNQGIAEELQRSRAAKTREEVEVLEIAFAEWLWLNGLLYTPCLDLPVVVKSLSRLSRYIEFYFHGFGLLNNLFPPHQDYSTDPR